MPTFSPPRFADSGGITKRQPLVGTTPATSNPAQDIYNLQRDLLTQKRALVDASNPSNQYRAAANTANRNVIETYNPAYPARAAATGARRALIDATAVQNAGTRNYLQQTAGMDAAAEQERQALSAAGHDVLDLGAVARAMAHRRAVNALKDAAGIPRDIEINVAQGTTGLPVGVAPTLRTNAEYLADKFKDTAGARDYQRTALKNALDLSGQDVADARTASSRADLNLENATQGASYYDKLSEQDLRDYLDRLGFQRDSVAADLADAQLGPYGKELYIDPRTGESRYVTPAEKDQLDYAYQTSLGLERIPTQYELGQKRTQYATQQEGGGSALAQYDNADFVNMLANAPTSGDSSEVNPVLAAIRAEIVRRLVLKGVPQVVAENTAVQQLEQFRLAAQALQKREDKASGAGGGSGGIVVQAPATR